MGPQSAQSKPTADGRGAGLSPSAVAFADAVRWQPVRSLAARLDGHDPCEPGAPVPCPYQEELFGPGEAVADPHWYVIREWSSVDDDDFDEFARLIRACGYRARYIRPYDPRPLVNHYLEDGEWVYWFIYPNQLCRTRIEWRQHEPLEARDG